MSLPSLIVIARQLSEADISRLFALKRNLETLEAKRRKIAEQLAEVERQIVALTGSKAPKAPGKRGRKPGRKRGRPAKAADVPAKRGRPPKAKPAVKVGRPALSGPAREAMLARMAKARAARQINKPKG